MTITTGSIPKALWGERKPKMAEHWMGDAVKHPGALRATAKREGLIHGDETLSGGDLAKLSHSKSPVTRERAGLAKVFKHAQHNDGGTAFHCGSGCAYPSHGH